MSSYNQSFYDLKNALEALYDSSEAAAIAHEVMEHITGKGKLKRLTEKDTEFTQVQQEQYNTMRSALLTGKPMQYVIGTAWFLSRPFKVNEHVLIPRPETEELVDWVVDEVKMGQALSILDIGTGSGCIPISLKLAVPEANITTCDISADALGVAKSNAAHLKAEVRFLNLDFLRQQQELGVYDIIVSNPPYIPETEKESLHTNVRDHEPGVALFVPGDDALLFYREIAYFGKSHLKEGGAVYCELHVDYALNTKELFEKAGYKNIEVRNDMNGNLRMLKAKL